jgi:hypothetical protein
MQISHPVLIATMLCASSMGLAGQSTDSGTPQPPAQTSAPAQASAAKPEATPGAAQSPSQILQPSLDSLQQAVGAMQLEKWKKGSVRDEASSNVASIQRDLQATLPSLLKDADTTPGSMAKTLPVSRNLAALYDVLLRVVDGARLAAPADQFTLLQEAMANLEKGRHALDDSMQDRAATQEKQIGDLQIALKTRPAPVCPVTPPPAETTPAKKVVPRKRKPSAAKPAPKPGTTGTTPPASNSQPSSTTKPQQ